MDEPGRSTDRRGSRQAAQGEPWHRLLAQGQRRAALVLVGRKLRFTRKAVQEYIERSQPDRENLMQAAATATTAHRPESFVICGQDIILDALSRTMNQAGVPSLRSYVGSYDALCALYKDEVQLASSHLWDGETDTYNVPFVRRLLPGVPVVVVNLTYRTRDSTSPGKPARHQYVGRPHKARDSHREPREGGGIPNLARRALAYGGHRPARTRGLCKRGVSHTSLLAAPLHADGRTLPSAAKRLHVRWTASTSCRSKEPTTSCSKEGYRHEADACAYGDP